MWKTVSRISVGILSLMAMVSCGMFEEEKTCDESVRAMGYLLSTTCRPLSWGENLPIKIHYGTSLSKDAQNALNDAIQIWENATGKHLFEVVGTYDDQSTTALNPYVNIVGMRSSDDWTQCSDEDMICGKEDEPAKTIYFYKQFIYNANIFFNLQYPFTNSGDSQSYDLISIALHELGHMLGLDHDNATSPEMSVMNARIYRGTFRQTLSQRDIKRVNDLYPF